MTPEMTVILFTPSDYEALRQTMCHLRAQTAQGQLEVVITTRVAAEVVLPVDEIAGFTDVRVMEVGPVKTLAAAQAQAIRQARAPIVVIGEDHSFPEPEWAEALIAAHQRGYAAVGPAVINANPRTLTSWTNYIPYFGDWSPNRAAEERDGIASHNSSYKRDLLLAFGDRLEFLLAVEGLLHRELRSAGHRLWFESNARTKHVNFSRPLPLIGQSICGGKLYGASRAIWERWPAWRRWVYVFGSPVIPLIRLRWMWRVMAGDPAQHSRRWVVLPALAWGALWHAFGEALGYAFGAGNVEERFLNYETCRLRFVTSMERREFEA